MRLPIKKWQIETLMFHADQVVKMWKQRLRQIFHCRLVRIKWNILNNVFKWISRIWIRMNRARNQAALITNKLARLFILYFNFFFFENLKVYEHKAKVIIIRGKTDFHWGHNVLEIVVRNICIKYNSPRQELRLLEEDGTIPKPPLLLLQCKGYSFALI